VCGVSKERSLKVINKPKQMGMRRKISANGAKLEQRGRKEGEKPREERGWLPDSCKRGKTLDNYEAGGQGEKRKKEPARRKNPRTQGRTPRGV